MPEPTIRLLEVTSDLAEVTRVQEELEALWLELQLPEEPGFVVSLALEEILSNVLRHGLETDHAPDIRVTFRADAEAFEFEVSDACAPYNPLLRPDPDTTLPLEQRRPGGLGVYMVKKLADDIRYEWRDGRNHLWFRKRCA